MVRRVLVGALASAEEGRRPIGAWLAAAMRRQDPDFHPGVLGDPTFKSLVARFPDIGEIVPDPASADFVFVPRAGSEGASGVAASAALPSAGGRAPVLQEDLWLALVSPREDARRWIDLETVRLVTASEAGIDPGGGGSGTPGSSPSLRFLGAPQVSQEEMKALAREHAAGLALDLAEVEATLGEPDWYPRFVRLLAPVARDMWKKIHRRFVVDRFTAWAGQHGIAVSRFIVQRRGARDPAREANGDSGHRPRQAPPADVRALVHRAIDRMSEEELLDLRIPLRYLVER